MANQEHLNLLQHGVEIWNQWRRERPDIQPDLTEADLSEIDLTGVNLSRAQLHGAIFFETELGMANLSEADLRIADFRGADLSEAEFSGSDLGGADLSRADLSMTNFRKAILVRVNFQDAYLDGSNMSRAIMSGTIFAHVDLRETKGLVEIYHQGPSRIELYTVKLPQDGSALHFLRGAGVPDEWIDDYRAHMMHPILYHSCFISYSSKDDTLAHRLHADLQDHGVRCWFAPVDMKIGDKIRGRIDEAIHLQDKLLLLLSEHSIQSSWVEDEVEAALEKERRQQRLVLFPVRLDEQVMQTTQSWAAKLRRSRTIGDFTRWNDPKAYQQAFDRLLRDLKKADGLQDKERKL